MNTGLTFDMSDGPIMVGTWVNYNNGDYFTVKDTFIQDNQLIIQTTDNRMLNYDFIKNYYKVESENAAMNISKQIKSSSQNKDNTLQSIPKDVLNLVDGTTDMTGGSASTPDNIDYSQYMTDEDILLGNGGKYMRSTDSTDPLISNDYMPYTDQITKSEAENPHPFTIPINLIKQEDSEDLLFIKRALKNSKGPELDIKINWKDYPSNKIELLLDIFGVSIDNIVDWFIKDIDMVQIKESIKSTIINYITTSNTQETRETNEINAQDIKPHTEVVKRKSHVRKKVTK